MGVTQVQIGKRLGLSQKAVAFALSDNPRHHRQLRPETRRRIIEAADQLGYVPHRAARVLRSGKTFAIVLATDMSLRYTHVHELIEELEVALTPSGYHLNLELLHRVANADELFRSFGPGRCDGVISFGIRRQHEDRLLELRRRGVPVVAVDMARHPELDSVFHDVAAAARIGTEHLLERGRQRVALIVDEKPGPGRDARCQGYEAACRQAGVPVDRELVIPWPVGTPPSGLWQAIVARSPRPTGIACFNNELAVALFMEILRQGGRVPEEVAIVALADGVLHAQLPIPLTAVDTRHARVAQAAAERLLAQMDSPVSKPKQILVEPVLVSRAST